MSVVQAGSLMLGEDNPFQQNGASERIFFSRIATIDWNSLQKILPQETFLQSRPACLHLLAR